MRTLLFILQMFMYIMFCIPRTYPSLTHVLHVSKLSARSFSYIIQEPGGLWCPKIVKEQLEDWLEVEFEEVYTVTGVNLHSKWTVFGLSTKIQVCEVNIPGFHVPKVF